MQTFVVWTAMNWLFQEWTLIKCVLSHKVKKERDCSPSFIVGAKQWNRMVWDSVQQNEILLYTVLGSLMESITQMWFYRKWEKLEWLTRASRNGMTISQ